MGKRNSFTHLIRLLNLQFMVRHSLFISLSTVCMPRHMSNFHSKSFHSENFFFSSAIIKRRNFLIKIATTTLSNSLREKVHNFCFLLKNVDYFVVFFLFIVHIIECVSRVDIKCLSRSHLQRKRFDSLPITL